MKKTGTAELPLHYGSAPTWLFERMKKLAREIIVLIISEYGPENLLKKISDPFWFQAFGCVLGFDWHSSGLTTTVCGAIKEGLFGLEKELGFFVAGGKGRSALKAPIEIAQKGKFLSKPQKLIYASKISAKIDNNAVLDGYQLYSHSFFFTSKGKWAVIQQGMNLKNNYARRYHWLSDDVDNFVCEPHKAICGKKTKNVLNLVSKENELIRQNSVKILQNEKPEKIVEEYQKIVSLKLKAEHPINFELIKPQNFYKVLLKTYQKPPENFEKLLGIAGVGSKSLRALALVSELVFGSPIDYKDPARFAFAHGGKDGYPYPVDRKNYDDTIYFLNKIINKARIDRSEKLKAFERLRLLY